MKKIYGFGIGALMLSATAVICRVSKKRFDKRMNKALNREFGKP
jgi:hypothetical protein